MFLPLRAADAPPLLGDLVRRNEASGEALCATCDHLPGEVVLRFDGGESRARRDPATVELPDGRHLFHPVLALATHACEPNCRLDLEGRLMVAVRPIAAGDVRDDGAVLVQTRPGRGGEETDEVGAALARLGFTAQRRLNDKGRPIFIARRVGLPTLRKAA